MDEETRKNNDKAAYNGYIGGLSVDWMASMCNVTNSAIYKSIKRHKNIITNQPGKTTLIP